MFYLFSLPNFPKIFWEKEPAHFLVVCLLGLKKKDRLGASAGSEGACLVYT